MRLSPSGLSCLLICLACLGCEGNAVRTISSGSHAPYSDERWAKIVNKQDEKLRFIVWSNHAGATHAAVELLKQNGHAVVEPARMQELFDKQHIRLTHTDDDHFRVLKVGRLAGGNSVVFVKATDIVSAVYVGPKNGASGSNTVHKVSVAVRSVDLETGAVRWQGHSTFTQPITDPESAIPLLTKAAIARALCALERGKEWIEYRLESSGKWGCR